MHREHLKLIQEALKHDLPTILSGEEIRRLCSVLEADARALWAVRVLDAYADAFSRPSLGEHRMPIAPMGQGYAPAVYFSVIIKGEQLRAPTRDAARLAAATALYPDLPESVRRELGECP